MTMQQQRSARGARFKALVIIVVLFTVMQGSALWRLVYYDFTDNGEGWTYAHPGGGSAEARSSGVSPPWWYQSDTIKTLLLWMIFSIRLFGNAIRYRFNMNLGVLHTRSAGNAWAVGRKVTWDIKDYRKYK